MKSSTRLVYMPKWVTERKTERGGTVHMLVLNHLAVVSFSVLRVVERFDACQRCFSETSGKDRIYSSDI